MENTNKIKEAKEILKSVGYFVDNLWSVEDVMCDYKCDEEDAQDILYNALTNDHTMESIWLAIEYQADDEGIPRIER